MADGDFPQIVRGIHDRGMDLLTKIEILLERRGWPQYRLEREAGLSANRISKWKNGTGEPTVSQAARIARILEISLDELADDTKDLPEPDPFAAYKGKRWERRSDNWPRPEEILLTVYKGLGIDLEEAIRRISTPGDPAQERSKKHPG